MAEQIRLKIRKRVEGEIFPPGTVCTLIKRYEADNGKLATVDLECNRKRFWVWATDIEESRNA